MSKKAVFFFPSFASGEATAPLGLLEVTTPLLRADYSIQLIDSTITPDYKKRVLEEVNDDGVPLSGPACLFSALPGFWERDLKSASPMQTTFPD